ncbi:MAG TPA: ATP-binding protein, partial [Nannocystis sp.]
MSAELPEITGVGDALESLVHQFADPWAFLRELVQNAIDAGAAQIDVRLDHDPGRGVMIIEVADTGEGMTREIIDTRLTRLFSSSKEGDYTKIGRFGIGFVSVFALDPELVCVDTGRAGEYWRVVFRRDRTFERIRLESPVEGTTIRLYKAAGPADVDHARKRARETLEYWCKHVRVELRLDDELISRPMDLDGLCKVEHREEGTSLVMALSPEPVALRGYYHGGLTLHEEYDDSLPHIAFKLDSRFLEHTLTRDNVIRDDNFDKAMKIIAEVARGRVITALLAVLAREVSSPSLPPDQRDLLYRCAAAQFGAGPPDPAWMEHAVIPVHGGPPLSLSALRARKDRLWRAPRRTPLIDRMLAEGHTVVACDDNDPVERLIHAALNIRPKATAE